MRGHFFNYQAIARALLYVAIPAVISLTAIWLIRLLPHQPRVAHTGLVALTSDALLRELARCQSIGTAAQLDRACIAAWTENRHRFFENAP
jgi:conjugative transfer region protein TrbK